MTATLAIASLVTSAVGAGVSYAGARRQAAAQEDAGLYAKRLAQHNAEAESETAGINAMREREESRRRLAAVRAKSMGRGFSFAGSLAETYDSDAFILEQNIQNHVHASLNRQLAMTTQGDMDLYNAQQQASGTRAKGNAALLRSVGGMMSSAASGMKSGAFSTN